MSENEQINEDNKGNKEYNKGNKEYNKGNKEYNKGNKVVIMDFTATWCGPCQMQDPILEDLKKKFGNKVEFKKIDVDKEGELADKYVIRAVPTLIIEKDNKIFKKYVGVTPLNILEKDLEDVLR